MCDPEFKLEHFHAVFDSRIHKLLAARLIPKRIGFDGDKQVRNADFQTIRGAPQDNDFIIDMQQRLANKKQTAHDLITRLQQLA